jgi:hypothetical protein
MKSNTSCTIEMPVSLRSDGVRVHPGMPFGFAPEYAFSFTGIPIYLASRQEYAGIEGRSCCSGRVVGHSEKG